MPAAQAAVAAQRQGKFWQMHDKLFGGQQELSDASHDKWAKEIGLDLAKFKKDETSEETKKQIQSDMGEASNFGARGTPAFFINGRSLSGAQPLEAFKKIVDEEISAANQAIKAGVAPDQVYAAFMKNAKDKGAEPANKPQAAPPQDTTVYKVPVGDAPVQGPEDAPVTIVEFSDFQCPFCSRVEGTMNQIHQTYGDKVRVAWKNNPLPFHEHAMDAALAAVAAAEQGKFWEMHGVLFKNQQALDKPSLEKYATELGLDMNKWKATIASDKAKAKIQEDMKLAEQMGARGTPSFFINGKAFRGAQPFDNFKTIIDASLKDADALVAKGTSKSNLYAEIIKGGKEKADVPPPPKQAPQDNTIYKALVEDAPVKGAKNAKVTIVEFSDFQCPFCGRVEGTIDQVLKLYPNDVKLAFKELPLPFHQNAHIAAEAALAAKDQGKFWEMHDVMYKNQQALDRPNLEKYAAQIGLNVDKFKSALDSGKYKQKVDAELAEGNKIGARGTPSFFVNGKLFVGAQPFEAFKAKIDEELKNADAVMAKEHVKADKVYDTLMKTAKEGQAPPAQQQGAAEPAAEHVMIAAGDAPAKGPKSAQVTILEFSDFQ